MKIEPGVRQLPIDANAVRGIPHAQAVVDFSGAGDEITVVFEMERQTDGLRHIVRVSTLICVNTGSLRSHTRKYCSPGRTAYRRYTVRIGKKYTSVSQTINIRRPDIRVAIKTAGPVSHIINCNE